MFLTVSWDMHTSQATPDDVPEAMHEHEASRGPLKGAMSVLLGSETETREFLEGTEENSDSRQGIIDLPSRIIYFVLFVWPPNIRLLAPCLILIYHTTYAKVCSILSSFFALSMCSTQSLFWFLKHLFLLLLLLFA